MTSWDEIKRLAADFQRTQTSDTLEKLSERNCIDIVKKLTELHLIELIYTCDGKEFVTPEHLLTEIKDEIYVNGGRMHLHDLAAALNVDYQHVENRAKELGDEYSLILGQVIHSNYKLTLEKLIRECMFTTGQLSIADFSKSLDLPSEFLHTLVKELMPKVMDDYIVGQDERTYYTADMMDRYKSIISGTLFAISKPTSIASLMKRLDIKERIFVPIVEELIKGGRIDASIENRLFIPAVYARRQNEWIGKFYESNLYIEYDVISRMDIKQPKLFLKKRFPKGMPLKTCFINPDLLSQVESLIEECITSNGWIDITSILPTAIEADDIELLLQEVFKQNKQLSSSCSVFDKTNVCSSGFITTCRNSFEAMMSAKVQEDLKHGKLVNYFLGGKLPKEVPPANVEKKIIPIVGEEEDQPGTKGNKRDKKDKRIIDEESDEEQSSKKGKGKKSGGGAQGREIKQKAVKKKYFTGNKGTQKNEEKPNKQPSASLPEKQPLIFLETDEIVDKLKKDLRSSDDVSEEFFESIARTIEDGLNSSYVVLAKQTLDEFLKSQDEEEEAKLEKEEESKPVEKEEAMSDQDDEE